MTKEAMTLALEALERCGSENYPLERKAIKALEKALAKQEQDEPVAMRYDFDGYGYKYIDSGSGSDWQTRIKDAEPVYTKPYVPEGRQPAQKPLMDEQREEIARGWRGRNWTVGDIIDAIEAAHGIKENT